MSDGTIETETCKTDSAACPRCPFARLLGSGWGRGSLVVLLMLAVGAAFLPGRAGQVSMIAGWMLAIGICLAVVIPAARGGQRRAASERPS